MNAIFSGYSKDFKIVNSFVLLKQKPKQKELNWSILGSLDWAGIITGGLLFSEQKHYKSFRMKWPGFNFPRNGDFITLSAN